MAYEQNPNSGSLFRNEKKNAPNQPDYEGNALIGGKTYRIAAWLKTSKNGIKYMSLAFNEPQPVHQSALNTQQSAPIPASTPTPTPRPAPRPAPVQESLDPQEDDLPF